MAVAATPWPPFSEAASAHPSKFAMHGRVGRDGHGGKPRIQAAPLTMSLRAAGMPSDLGLAEVAHKRVEPRLSLVAGALPPARLRS
jgi:hypothetical protein